MKNIWILMAATIALPSCLTSVNPLVTHANIISFDQCVGSWEAQGSFAQISRLYESDLAAAFELVAADSLNLSAEDRKIAASSYILSYYKNGLLHYMHLQFTMINKEWFAQFAPLEVLKITDPGYRGGSVYGIPDSLRKSVWEGNKECYSFARARISHSALEFRFIDGEYIQTQLKNGNMALKHETDLLFGRTYITATNSELQAFLRKYSGDERLYSKKNMFILNRVSL